MILPFIFIFFLLIVKKISLFQYFSCRFLVEVDIVLPREMRLDVSHQIGETLQQKLEKLSDVERAFVHVDWETDHDPQTEHRIT